MRKLIAIIINLLLPGLGSFVINKPIQAVLQLIITLAAIILMLTVWLTFWGLVLFTITWIWALIIGLLWKTPNNPK